MLYGDLMLRSFERVYAVFFGRPPLRFGGAGGSEETTGGGSTGTGSLFAIIWKRSTSPVVRRK
jgi:hypothetical protein